MSAAVQELLSVLDLEELDVNLFRGRSPQSSWQRVFGGQVIGQALVAAVRTVEASRPPHSMHAYFLLPGDPKVPIIYDVDRIRDGGSFTTRRVTARQHGHPIFSMLVSFHVEETGGLEQSKNVIYTGQEATQQILAGLNWIAKEKGAKSFFFIGSDYIWPRTSNKIARKHVENVLKGKVVGEEYYPLGNTQFNSVINKIKLTKPDVIFTDVVGGSNVAFYKQLKAAGIDLSKQTLLTISVLSLIHISEPTRRTPISY